MGRQEREGMGGRSGGRERAQGTGTQNTRITVLAVTQSHIVCSDDRQFKIKTTTKIKAATTVPHATKSTRNRCLTACRNAKSGSLVTVFILSG